MNSNSPTKSGKGPSNIPNPQFNLAVRKKRALTKDLKLPQAVLHELYTEELIRERIDYSEQRLNSTTRYLTPNSRKLLELYKNALYDFELERSTMTGQETRAALDELRHFESTMNSAGNLNDVSSDKLLKELIDFRRQVYLARYGYYAAHAAAEIRSHAAATGSPYGERLSGAHLWTKISQDIH